MRFAIFGLRTWGETTKEAIDDGDTLWDWLTDQLLVVQHRYAFSVGCIAFAHDQPNRCLLVQRPFPEFADDDKVLLWPGGRLRGSLDNFETEIRRMVKAETGCSVTLLAPGGGPRAPFSEKVNTYNTHTRASDLENEILQPPIIVMQQNRRQSHDVPGHIDLLYLGRVEPGQQVKKRGYFIDISNDFKEYDEQVLWPDTRRCIKQAAEIYAQLISRDTPASAKR